MLEKLKKLNPDIEIFDVTSEEFTTFGRIIKGMDVTEIITEAKKIEMIGNDSNYKPSVEAFEKLNIAGEIKIKLFGESEIQVGYCWGYNSIFGATEWHTSSEINIAVTDLLIIVGHVWDVKDNTIDTSKFRLSMFIRVQFWSVMQQLCIMAPVRLKNKDLGGLLLFRKAQIRNLKVNMKINFCGQKTNGLFVMLRIKHS